MDIFWRKETELRGEADDGRRKKRGGNSDNARFHISLEKMNEPSPVSSLAHSHCCWRSATGNTFQSQDGTSFSEVMSMGQMGFI